MSAPRAAVANAYDVFDDATREDIAHLLWMRNFDPGQVPAALARQLTSDKNSPATTGERMRRFLDRLIDHPVAHTRNDADTYRAMLPYCGTLSPLQLYVLRGLLPRSANDGYEPVRDPVDFQFPRDHALQLQAQFGWHFLVGNCWDTAGQEYGIELMFVGAGMFPPAVAAEYGLSAVENQMIEVQLAVSVAGERHHQIQPIVALGTSGLIETSADPFSLSVGRNLLASQRPGELFPLRARAWGLDKGDGAPTEIELDIVFTSGKRYIAQGADGAMPNLDGIGSLYYSIPNIRIDASRSRLRIGDRHVQLQSGLFWLDHQWGALGFNRSEVMRAADAIAEPRQEGWDWFEAQFEGDRQLTLFAPHKREHAAEFYDRVGTEPPGAMRGRIGGKYMNATEQISTIWGTVQVTDWIKAQRSPDPQRYPATHVWYPNRWEFEFPELPADIRCFSMTPIVESGQSSFLASGTQISEGAVRLHDRAGKVLGRGFAESVGYADTRPNMLRLAGLPQTPHMLELVAPKAAPLHTRIRNALYVLAHRKQLLAVLRSAKGTEFFVEGVVPDARVQRQGREPAPGV